MAKPELTGHRARRLFVSMQDELEEVRSALIQMTAAQHGGGQAETFRRAETAAQTHFARVQAAINKLAVGDYEAAERVVGSDWYVK